MKKILVCLLSVVMLLGVCGCGIGSGETTAMPTETESLPQELKVGYAKVDITPDESVPLAGYSNSSMRMSKGVLYRTYATCLAITNESGQIVLLISADLITSDDSVVGGCRKRISKETGIPLDRVIIGTTHTHAAVAVTNTAEPSITRYNMKIGKWMVQVATEAIADMKTAELYTGSVETEQMNFIKHYQAKDNVTGEITIIGDNFGSIEGKTYVGHATEVDPTMHLIKVVREGEKDIIWSNWRAHPHLDSRLDKSDLSADYIGAFREAMEEKLNCNFIYFQGAAGNVNAHSRISGEGHSKVCTEYGQILADQAIAGLKNMKKVEGTIIKTKQIAYEAKVDHSMDDILPYAQIVADHWHQNNDAEAATKLGLPYGIRSPYHATAAITRAGMGESVTMELNVITIADTVGIVTAPGELFDTNSAWLEAQAPYEMVMTFGYTNGHYGYFPSAIAFEYTSYETDITRFVPGTAEKIQETFLGALKELKGE